MSRVASRVADLRDDLDDLTLYAERVEELLNHFDVHALHDMAARLHEEIRATRRELLMLDAHNLMSLARNSGGLA